MHTYLLSTLIAMHQMSLHTERAPKKSKLIIIVTTTNNGDFQNIA